MILINTENYVVSHIKEDTFQYREIDALNTDEVCLSSLNKWVENHTSNSYLHKNLKNFISVPDVLFFNFISVASGDNKQKLDDIIDIVKTSNKNSFTDNLKFKHNKAINSLINNIFVNAQFVYEANMDFNKGKFYALAIRGGGGSWIPKYQMYGKYEVITDEPTAVKLLLSGCDDDDYYGIKKVLSYEEVSDIVGTNIETLFLS